MKIFLIQESFISLLDLRGKTTSEVQEENDAQNQADLAKQAKIIEEVAIKTALEKVSGTVNKVELEDEDGPVKIKLEDNVNL